MTGPVSIGGTVVGLAGTLVLRNSNGESLTVTGSSFTFPTRLSAGTSYAVTITTQPNGQNCVAFNATGVAGSTDITNVNILCANLRAPDAPKALSAAAANGQITISFGAPTNNGGSPITGYAASCSAASASPITGTATATATTIVVTGLNNGTAYSCTVSAANAYGSSPASNAVTATPNASTFRIEAWADNWFAVYAGNSLIGEDHIPVTQVKSFNSETFTFAATYPFDLNFIIKDYVQLDYLNGDTGLEYINNIGGTQQMGDGGFIMQLTDTDTGKLAAVSGTAFKCLVIHKAPTNKSCASQPNPSTAAGSCGLPSILAEPANWKSSGFDTSAWSNATTYSATQIGVKEGYYDITWQPAARLIWTADLQTDNTLLCKLTVNRPP